MGLGTHKETGGRIYRVARWLLVVVALGYLAYRIKADWTALPSLRIDWGMLALMIPGLAAALAGQVWAWQWNLKRLGSGVSYHALFRTYYVANLGRYVPGKIWSLAGMVAGGLKLGIRPEVMSASLILGLASSLVSGVFVGSVIAVASGRGGLFSPWSLLVPALALVAIWPSIFRRWVGMMLRLLRRREGVPVFSAGVLWRSVLHYALVWCGYGTAVGALALAFNAQSFWLYFAVFPLAYIVGYVALFAPGGWGVREGALVVLAGGGAIPLAVSIAQRLILTIIEAGLFSYSIWSWRHD